LPLALYGGVLGALAGSIVWALLTLSVRLVRRRPWRRLPPRWVLVALLCGLVCFLLSEAFGSALAMTCF
jgi:H+/Cl- antiporter ClcA